MLNVDLWGKYKRLREAVYKKYSKMHHAEYLHGPNVLVLSPHPDDDVFACGGTLIRHISQGHTVKVVYLCNGGKGITGKSETEAANIRKQEAKAAAALLGLNEENLHFLDMPDDRLCRQEARAAALLKPLIDRFKPDLVYLPAFTDNHSDHFSTNRILKATAPAKAMIAAYEVWTPLVPNLVVDISAEMDRKTEAIRAHRSQLRELNYLDAIVSLNRYRACLYTKKKMAYAEAFCYAPAPDYFALFD
ncbi:MAG: PIG-L family deacetylase [Lewinellaceae bacterium]|nr:PIG-L family deacetylase [Lewinellaceae bacterium]